MSGRAVFPGAAGLLLLTFLAACASAPATPITAMPAPASASAASSALPAPTATQIPALEPTVSAAKPATRLALRQVGESGKLFGLTELEIETDAIARNPFDPAQLDLSVRFTAPSGKAVLVPAFSYQEFDPATLAQQGGPTWRVRFTPTEAGQWQAQAELASPTLSSSSLSFTVAANPSAHGFVRINQQNPHYMAFDDGSFYFPIGLNLGWASQPNLGVLADYERWLDRLSQNGGNVGRVWMSAWAFGIEWNDTGLGDYSGRMKQAWLLDQVFKLAEQRGVYLMLTLLNHGAFSTSVNPEWNDNPYNIANGGPLKEPRLFVRNKQARELFKRRVHYIAARWGYSPNLFAWEWWNEVSWTPIDDSSLKPWVIEMTAYIQLYDPNHHLVSLSYAGAGGATALWKMPELSFVQLHDYSGNDPAKLLPLQSQAMSLKYPDKPFLLAEYGLSGDGASALPGRDVIQFHNGLWAAPFSGMSSTAMYWWWDTFVDPQNLWSEYKGISTFLEDENLAALAPAKAALAPAGASVLLLQSRDRALAWLRSDAYDVAPARKAYDKARQAGQADGWVYAPPALSGLQLTVTGLADGEYSARWFDPKTAAWLDEQALQVRGGTATLAVPTFAQDLAVKIVPAKKL
ncbi:MAG: DUF5060 domain-containing protein [Chloroflexota bacterium]|nr:DUF5060 domain-containing protein [Chloroflexota bacterium]